MENRDHILEKWAAEQLKEKVMVCRPIAGGASLRRFFRCQHQGRTYILMDIPPTAHESCGGYLNVTQLLQKQKLHVPAVIAADVKQGFVLMEDFGDALLWSSVTAANADYWYTAAMQALLTLQEKPLDLPIFTREMMAYAMEGFQNYCLTQYLGLSLSQEEQRMLADFYDLLLDSAISQPQAPMHRDYHSQNLLCLPNNELGLVDFQDAKLGPITYDLVSVLRDCYIDWPIEQVDKWAHWFYQELLSRKRLANMSEAEFIRYFDWMGIERHLKACFTFTRKAIDAKDKHYLQYLPRTFAYIQQALQKYSELAAFRQFFEEKVLTRVSLLKLIGQD